MTENRPSWAFEFESEPIKPVSIAEMLNRTGMNDIELAEFLVHHVWVMLVHRHDCSSLLHLENAEERAKIAWALHVILRGLRKAGYIQDAPEETAT